MIVHVMYYTPLMSDSDKLRCTPKQERPVSKSHHPRKLLEFFDAELAVVR